MRRPSRKEDSRGRRSRTLCLYCLRRIFYENPLNIVGTVPVWEDKVLLCRRAIEPRKGYWTLPAGHQEMKETTRDGAARETREEAGIDFRIADEPYVYLDLAHASQSHVIFLAAMESPEANPGPESFEARLFSEDEIPWDKIAFNSIKSSGSILTMPKPETFLSTTSSDTNKEKYLNYH